MCDCATGALFNAAQARARGRLRGRKVCQGNEAEQRTDAGRANEIKLAPSAATTVAGTESKKRRHDGQRCTLSMYKRKLTLLSAMTKQKVGMPKDQRFKYEVVLTSQNRPDKRFNCNTVVGEKRPTVLPKQEGSGQAWVNKEVTGNPEHYRDLMWQDGAWAGSFCSCSLWFPIDTRSLSDRHFRPVHNVP